MTKQSDSKLINQELFYGGKSTDKKVGIANSFADALAMDFRKNPSQMTVLPGAATVSGNTVQDLVLDMAQTPDGNRYAVGDAGWFYRVNSSNIFSSLGKLNEGSGGGVIYRQDTDFLYMTGQTAVSRFGMIQKSALTNKGLQKDYYAQSVSTDPKVAQTLTTDVTGAYIGSGTLRSTGTTNTYTLKSSISEVTTDYCLFIPDVEPFYSINVYVVAKGTGDWTLTLHDSGNNTIATVTKTNANLTSGAFNEFKFSSQVRATVQPNSAQYHWHLTSTVTDGTVGVVTSNDLSTANFQLYAYRMVQPNNGLHPMTVFQQYICIGNERYLTVWEPLSDNPDNTEWQRHRLTFPPGYECTSLAVNDEYLLIACEKRSSSGSRSFQEGIIFFWDGAAQTYNFFIEVKMGSPYSLYTYQNITYMYIAGALYAWTGAKQLVKVRTFEGTDSEYTSIEDNTFVYPNMITSRRDIMLLGYPSSTSITNLPYGVYSWGAIDKNYPQSFGYSYVLASQTRFYTAGNGLKIGMAKNYVDTLYMSWKENGAYGVDVVNNSSSPAQTFYWESLIYDGGAVYKDKQALRYRLTYTALPSGVTITPKYKIGRGNIWTYGTPQTAGSTEAYAEINTRFDEIQVGFDGVSSGATTSPVILGSTLEVRTLAEERDL